MSNFKSKLDEIMNDLIIGHNYDYARSAILDWHERLTTQAVREARIDGAIMGAKFGNAALRQYNVAGKPMNLDEIRDVGIKQAEDWAKRQC